MNINQNLKSISFVVLPAWKLYTTETKYQNKQTKNVEEILFQFSFLSLFVTFSFGLSIVRLNYLTFISFRLMFSYSNSNINGKDQNQFNEGTLKKKNSALSAKLWFLSCKFKLKLSVCTPAGVSVILYFDYNKQLSVEKYIKLMEGH